MKRLLAALALVLAAGGNVFAETPAAPSDGRTQEAIQRYNAGVGALQRRDLEYALYQFRQAVRLNPAMVEGRRLPKGPQHSF